MLFVMDRFEPGFLKPSVFYLMDRVEKVEVCSAFLENCLSEAGSF